MKTPAPLEISNEHMIFVKGHRSPIRADKLKVDDVLYGSDPKDEYVVSRLERISRKGVYLPLTAEGTIVVNDVLASTYVSFLENNAANRWLTSMVSEQAIFGALVSPFSLVCGTMGMDQVCRRPEMLNPNPESGTGS